MAGVAFDNRCYSVMLASVKWLCDYVDVRLSPQELALALTMVGLEVESVTDIQPSFSGLEVGRIETIHPHPETPTLSVCRVSTGSEVVLLVCGAGNIFVGALVPLARAGARVGSQVIGKTVIRGVGSEGMLCSEEELGLGSDQSGVFILPSDLEPGTSLTQALDLADVVLEIGVTPNRSDCLSIIGIAREVAALTGGTLRLPSKAIQQEGPETALFTSVTIQDPELCPRYAARLIQDVKIAPSPFWLRNRLAASGLRPINNVVDVTNFVMLELGQPLHAFDHRRLTGGRIVVRRARNGELFQTLDDREHLLSSDTLMICDSEKPVAIAGIMGGKNSEVQADTTAILLESAYFSPVSIRRTAKALGSTSDASFRFERGIDPEGVPVALDRAAQMIAELAGGKICRKGIDEYPRKIAVNSNIPLRVSRLNQILGTNLGSEEIKKTLNRIEMRVSPAPDGSDGFQVTPPTCRVDITREIDLIEEVARIYGYDRIAATLPRIDGIPSVDDNLRRVTRISREKLTGRGFSEVINYSFIPVGFGDDLLLPEGDRRRNVIRIGNPLTEDQSVMRTSLVYGMLENWKRNANAGCHDLRIFETGRVYFRTSGGCLPDERNILAALMTGRRYPEGLDSPDTKVDYYDLKGFLEPLLSDLGLEFSFAPDVSDRFFLHPGRSSLVCVRDQEIGVLGELNPLVLDKFDLKNRGIYFEVDLDALAAMYTGQVKYREISRFPSSVRDAAFVVPECVRANALLSAVHSAHEVLLEKVDIFDLYAGHGLLPSTKSLGLRFFYRSCERTLTDEEVNHVHGEIVRRIGEATGAVLRGTSHEKGGFYDQK